MTEIEARSHAGTPNPKTKARIRVALLFLTVVLGILAKWFWEIGNEYLADQSKGFHPGPATAILVRVGLSLIAGGVTFTAIYNKIDKGTGDSAFPFLIAFQNGFFWQAIFDAVGQGDSGPAAP